MMREVAELSGNFRGELSLLDGGEGVNHVMFCEKKQETHGAVYKASETLYTLKTKDKSPCTRIAKIVQNYLGGRK